MYLVPYSWSHCTFTGFMIIAAPYQLLQMVWMFLIIKKVTASLAGGKKKKKIDEDENGDESAVPVAAGGVKVD